MNISMHNYERSTHNLDRVWRSSMSCGTLVPFMTEITLPGDTFDIDLTTMIRTVPTLAPLFGSFKVQLDVFSVPIRLYNAQLHMNRLGVGMKMSEIKLPMMKIAARGDIDNNTPDKFDQSTLMAYLGVRGAPVIRDNAGVQLLDASFKKNALFMLAYWDIYKNYYSNKQEEKGYVVTNESFLTYDITTCATSYELEAPITRPIKNSGQFNNPITGTWDTFVIYYTGVLDIENIYLTALIDPYTVPQDIRILDYFTILSKSTGTLALTPNFDTADYEITWIIPKKTGTGTDKVALRAFQLKNIDDT